jgi:Xaa-Pro aminopeptidase
MCNEYPRIVSRKWFDEAGYDGVFEESMTICVDSYIGKKGRHEGVELEEMALITEPGCEIAGKFPFKGELLS